MKLKPIPLEVLQRRTALWAELEMLGDPRTVQAPEDNLILDVDSYKLCHQAMYGRLGVTKSFSYIEPRINGKKMLYIGLQMFLKRMKPITHKQIDEAKEFFSKHIIGGAEMFPEADWRRVVDEFGGFPPLKIRGLKEGTVVPSHTALVTIECDVPGLSWMAAYFETTILRAVWYPTTVATKSYEIREALRAYALKSSDLAVEIAVMFMFHDFGARGVSSILSAGLGGAAHILAGSYGTDTITGALFANKYYGSDMSAFSVFATEHSIMTMRGRQGEVRTVRDLIKEYNKGPGTIVSIVSDGYDIYNMARIYTTVLKDEIIESGIRLVVRPDSGDPVEVILKLLAIFDEGFGSVVNSKGYKVLNVVRILQGDGLSTVESFQKIADAVLAAGFSIENIVFGMGGGLLQMVNRDTYKFAMKTCAAEVDGVWIDVFKDPITDPGKRSKKGRLTTVRHADGSITSPRLEDVLATDTDLMEDIWINGSLLAEWTVDEVRGSTAYKE